MYQNYQRTSDPPPAVTDWQAIHATRGPSIFNGRWWLGSAAKVMVKGTFLIKKDKKCNWIIKKVNAEWEWHDQIDAKSFSELSKDQLPFLFTIPEGLFDIYYDKLKGTDFYVNVKWRDKWDNESLTFSPALPDNETRKQK